MVMSPGLAARRPPAARDGSASRPRAPPYHDVSYPCWRRISPMATAARPRWETASPPLVGA
jgi:hypothetical protein